MSWQLNKDDILKLIDGHSKQFKQNEKVREEKNEEINERFNEVKLECLKIERVSSSQFDDIGDRVENILKIH